MNSFEKLLRLHDRDRERWLLFLERLRREKKFAWHKRAMARYHDH